MSESAFAYNQIVELQDHPFYALVFYAGLILAATERMRTLANINGGAGASQ
jgi:hypothetical protein